MKTAIELADEFPEQNLTNIEPDAVNILNGWGIEAVAMLLQQAGQIEALTKQVFALTGEVANKADYAKSMYAMHQEAQAENEALLKANLDCVDHFNTLKTDYDALKALVDNPRNTPFGKEAEKLADNWLAANAPGGWIDDLRNKCEALEITNDALKADAERQDAKIKALRDSLTWALSNISEEHYGWPSDEDAAAHNAAIAAAKE